MNVRRYRRGEEDALRVMCRDTTLRVNGEEHGAELAERRAARLESKRKWQDRVRRNNPFVAEQDDALVGFAELTGDGRIAAFYSDHRWQHRGGGRALYEAVEDEAQRLRVNALRVDASTSARGVFLANRFRVVEEHVTLTDAMPSTSYSMEKPLRP